MIGIFVMVIDFGFPVCSSHTGFFSLVAKQYQVFHEEGRYFYRREKCFRLNAYQFCVHISLAGLFFIYEEIFIPSMI